MGARLAHELVRVLELSAAGAEFNRRRNAGRFVHIVLPIRMRVLRRCLSPIASCASAPSRKLLWQVLPGAGAHLPPGLIDKESRSMPSTHIAPLRALLGGHTGRLLPDAPNALPSRIL